MPGTLADLNHAEKRRVARLVEQLLAVQKAHEAASARWREAERARREAEVDALHRSLHHKH